MNIDPKAVGRKIREARIRAGFKTPAALAAVIFQESKKNGRHPVDPETVRLWEKGEVLPPRDKIDQLTAALQVKASELLFDDSAVPPSDSSVAARPNRPADDNETTDQIFEKPEIRRRVMELDREIADMIALWMQMPKAARTRYIRMIVEEGLKKADPWFDEVPDALLAKLSAHDKIAGLKKPPPPDNTH